MRGVFVCLLALASLSCTGRTPPAENPPELSHGTLRIAPTPAPTVDTIPSQR